MKFEEFQEKIKGQWATLTKSQFLEACAEVMGEGKCSELVKMSPLNIMIFTMFASELADKIFGELKETESEEKK